MQNIKPQEPVIITLDAQKMLQAIEEKYGKKPIISEKGKKMKEEFENKKKEA
jgi:hypothetical protein